MTLPPICHTEPQAKAIAVHSHPMVIDDFTVKGKKPDFLLLPFTFLINIIPPLFPITALHSIL
jgi:hypothetical protein